MTPKDLKHFNGPSSFEVIRTQPWALNVRRRVYDCLNVFLAADFLKEDKATSQFSCDEVALKVIEQERIRQEEQSPEKAKTIEIVGDVELDVET